MILSNAEVCYFMLEAIKEAAKSPDTSTQCGSVIVYPYGLTIVSRDHNRPIGHNDVSVYDKSYAEKLAGIEHAERGAVYEAAWHGRCTRGCVMFATWASCVECSKAILRAGITDVYTLETTQKLTPARWRKSVDAGLDLLRGSNVNIHFVPFEILGDTYQHQIRFDKKDIIL